jgi:glycosyltransferase involved in cell wall biosynthesis
MSESCNQYKDKLEQRVPTDESRNVVRNVVKDNGLSVVMPVFNLAGKVAGNLLSTAEIFAANRIDVELVPVDDGSTDGSWNEILSLEGKLPCGVSFRPIKIERSLGKGAALRYGVAASRGDYIMLLDGDLDIHPKQTPVFFDVMQKTGADIVIGSKRHKNSIVQYPWHRRIVSIVYFMLVRLFVGLPITDTQTGMKLFKRQVLLDALDRMLVKTYAFDLELLAIASSRGAKMAEAPVVINFGNKFGALKISTVKSMAIDSLAVFFRLRILKYYNSVFVPPAAKDKKLVSIVIACPNESWMLKECLEAIDAQTYKNFEVIVLPDSVTGKIRPAEKRNIGISKAKGEIIAFIDDDAFPDSHWLEYGVKYFTDETIGAVGGPAVTPPNDRYFSYLGGRVYNNLLVSGNYRYRYKAGGVCRDVDDYPSCNLLVRKSVLERIGSYRIDFWPGEDTLLCKDIIDIGLRIVYDPWVVVYHHRRPLFMPHLRQLGRYAFHRGYFCKRFPSNSFKLSYFIPSLFLVYIILSLVVLPLPFVDALFKTVTLMPMTVYAVSVAITAFSFNPVTWALTAFGVFSSHLVYGFKFIQGLAASKAPCEFIGNDHASV